MVLNSCFLPTSIKVQTLGELRMRGTAKLMDWAFSMRLLVVSTLVARGESDTD